MPSPTFQPRSSRWESILLAGVLLVAFLLRIFRLGSNSLWNDEAGQALAAAQPTVQGLLQVVRSHVAAFPLDYLVSALALRISTSETVLRFPAVLWGTLAVFLSWLLLRKISGAKVAFVTAWLLALSTDFIYYSQEMRFYASLFCFYSLSTLLLLYSLERTSKRVWGAYIIATVIGAYFHPYVLLSAIFGAGSILIIGLSPGRGDKEFGKWLIGKPASFAASLVLVGLLFLPGYLSFGIETRLDYPLLQYADSVIEVVIQSFGWLTIPFRTGQPPIFGFWELLNAAFAMLGLITVLRSAHAQKALLILLFGSWIQIALIAFLSWTRGYWFVHRQILHLAPATLALTASGMVQASAGLQALVEHLAKKQPASSALRVMLRPALPPGAIFLAALILLAALAAGPRLRAYYDHVKSNARQVVESLLAQPGVQAGPIFILPGYEEKIYRFYLGEIYERDDLIPNLRPTSWDDFIQSSAAGAGPACMIAPASLEPGHRRWLQRRGYIPLVDPKVPWYGSRYLFYRER